MIEVIQQQFTVSYNFPIIFTRNVFDSQNLDLLQIFKLSDSKPDRMLVVIDSGVAQAKPSLIGAIDTYVGCHGDMLQLAAPPCVVSGGEICKQSETEVQNIHALVEKYHICRHSFLIAIGGGAVLDMAGYAAATAHRGVRLIRMPTTTLSQNDAGIGVKNGINAYGRKNFIGTFAPPFAVINDFDFLDTLPPRDSRSGIAEAIKVAIIKDRRFFSSLYRQRRRLAVFSRSSMEQMIVRCASLHTEHIAQNGDPFELGSARPLDFGHWAAHKIEDLTHGEVRHGEAVAIGIAIDSLYASHTDLLSRLEVKKILSTLTDVGFTLYHPVLKDMDCRKALEEFREHLGGKLTITLPCGIGNRTEVHKMDTNLLTRCIDMLAAL